MTSHLVLMVSSDAVCGMKAVHVNEDTRVPLMPKARDWAQAYLVDTGRLSWPDAAYRQSEARDTNAGFYAAAWAGETQNDTTTGRQRRG